MNGVALADLIADVHAHPWVMAPVPPNKWAWFTKLPSTGAIEMWTRSDLLADEGCEGFDKWMEIIGANGTGEGYPVVLHCECGAQAAYEVTLDAAYDGDFTDEDSTMMQLDGLDDLMRPFVEEHAPHRWQLRLGI